MAAGRSYWLVKTEPDCFSIHDLAACPDQTTCWSGVRNYQARNMMRDQMRPGDRVLFYHASADPPVVAGTAVVARGAYPDHTAWDKRDSHFDPKASPENPIWQMVDIRLETVFAEPLPIGLLRGEPGLTWMELLRTGSRLAVQPGKPREFEIVLELAKAASGKSKSGKVAAKKSAKAAKRPVAKTNSTAVRKQGRRTVSK